MMKKLCFTTLLALLSLPAKAELLQFDVAGYQIEGRSPLDQQTVTDTLIPFVGKQKTIQTLQQAAAALQGKLSAAGHGFYRVILPPQTIKDTVKLQLVMMPVGDVFIEGNQHFSSEQIQTDFPSLQPGLTPDTFVLGRNLAQFNDHPAHQAVLVLSENRVREAIDVKVKVADQPPTSFFTTLQNNGNSATGKWRLGVGWQTSSLAGTDQQLTLSYTTSPDQHLKDVSQLGAFWKAPLYASALDVSAYMVHSSVNSGVVADYFDVSGKGDYAGISVMQYWMPTTHFQQGLKVGLDYKAYGNTVLFEGSDLGSAVTTVPFTLGWFGTWKDANSKAQMSLDWVSNLPGGSKNDDAHHAASRTGAKARWQLWRASLNYQFPLIGEWSGVAKLQGQYTRQPLVSGEQFGAGGAQSVRGYQEREAQGDQGSFVGLEAWSPLLTPTLRALVFAEAGTTRRLNVQTDEVGQEKLAGLGVGLRWQPSKQYGVSLDVARAMKSTHTTPAGTWRANLIATARF